MEETEKDNNINNRENYGFSWIGKQKAIADSTSITNKNLYFCEEESKDYNSTKNLYIEGDNLEALKLLKKHYINKIKTIYIDPPYNTGNNFVYKDNFLQKNKNSQYKLTSREWAHCNWCSMMYPRLKLARDFLTEDGIIFISVDDNELTNLQNICNEIFGEKNFVSNFIWKKKGGSGNTEKIIGNITEYIVCYAKNKKAGIFNYRYIDRKYKFKDSKGPYNLEGLEKTNIGQYERKTMQYPMIDPATNTKFLPKKNMRWTIGEEAFNKYLQNKAIFFDYKNMSVKRIKRPEDYEKSKNVYLNLLDNLGSLSIAKNEVENLLNTREAFETPKPISLIKHLLSISTNKNDIVLDFFSGSATTAHAVMQLNKEDNGNRKFIMVQIPDTIPEKSEAFKNGYKNICDIGKDRIEKAGEKIKNELDLSNINLDVGFCVYKIK